MKHLFTLALFLNLSIFVSAQAVTPCENGFSGEYACDGYDLLTHYPLSAVGGGDNGNGDCDNDDDDDDDDDDEEDDNDNDDDDDDDKDQDDKENLACRDGACLHTRRAILYSTNGGQLTRRAF